MSYMINQGHSCSVEDCESPATRKLLCGLHYKRMMKHGDPLIKRAIVTEKECVSCRTVKDASSFYKKGKNKDGLRSNCKVCFLEQRKIDKAKVDPEYVNARARARYNPERQAVLSRKYRFNLSQDEYESLLDSQDHLCAICESPNPRARWDKFQVDHDHDSGQVRGLLCGPCNRMLGQGGDKSSILRSGALYLERWGK